MSKPQSPADTEKLHKSALLSVACNTIMLATCDDIKETQLYRQQIKQLTNSLTKELERSIGKLYAGISPDEEMQYYNLIRLMERVTGKLAAMTPKEIEQVDRVLDALKRGEIFEATTDKQMNNLINQKRVKPLKTAEFVHPATGTVPFP